MHRALALCVLALFACSSDDPAPSDSAEDSGTLDASVRDASAPDARTSDARAPDASVVADASAVPVDASVDASVRVDPVAESMHDRADRALADLMLNYWASLRANTNTIDWMYAHYWEAVLDAAERRGPSAFAGTAAMFYELQERRGWINDFYDDENWLVLALLHAHSVTGEARYLERAKSTFADIMKAWDTSCCGAQKGGLWWKKPMESKVTAINGGAVVSAARLYAATKQQSYLDFALQVYEFWRQHMVDAKTGHVNDGFDNSGKINTAWRFSYNEGIFLGGIVELTRATQDRSRLPLAHTIAGFMLREESASTPAGRILSDGKCSGDGEMFKGIGARYLGELYALDPTHTEYRDFLRDSAEAAWTLARDPATGRFVCDWAGPFDAALSRVGSLGSAAVALAAAAKAWGPGEQRPSLTYEAEEANLKGPGVEANYAGFQGWGYVAGWGTGGQSIAFTIDAPSAGKYSAQLRYATGDDAQRTLRVGSTTSTLQFPRTAGYDDYASITTTVELAKGVNTLTLESASGYLNLDALVLAVQ